MGAIWPYLALGATLSGFGWFLCYLAYNKGFREGDDFAASIHALSRKRPPVTVELRRHNGGYVFVVCQKWISRDAKFVPEMTSVRFETVLEAEDAAKRFWPDCQPRMNRDQG